VSAPVSAPVPVSASASVSAPESAAVAVAELAAGWREAPEHGAEAVEKNLCVGGGATINVAPGDRDCQSAADFGIAAGCRAEKVFAILSAPLRAFGQIHRH